MEPRLTRDYLRDHIAEPEPGPRGLAETPDLFADRLIDEILKAAILQLSDDSDARDEMELSVPVTLRPVANAPMGGCIEVCIGIGIVVCYHRNFKGKRPGEG